MKWLFCVYFVWWFAYSVLSPCDHGYTYVFNEKTVDRNTPATAFQITRLVGEYLALALAQCSGKDQWVRCENRTNAGQKLRSPVFPWDARMRDRRNAGDVTHCTENVASRVRRNKAQNTSHPLQAGSFSNCPCN